MFFKSAGNLITIIALLKCTKLRKQATTMFIINLTASDLIYSAVYLPLMSAKFYNGAWVLGDTLCRLFPVIIYGNAMLSYMSIVTISINRLVRILFIKLLRNKVPKMIELNPGYLQLIRTNDMQMMTYKVCLIITNCVLW